MLKKLAVFLYRPEAERAGLGSPSGVRVKILAFSGGIAILGAFFVPFYASDIGRWVTARPDVAISASEWRAVYSESPVPCSLDARAAAGCLASPEDSRLWGSEYRRGDPEHRERTWARRGGEFWIGVALPAEALADAFARGANHLALGWIRGTADVWIDGRLFFTGARRSEPMVFTLPMDRLGSAQPMRVAIRVFHDTGHPDADPLSGKAGDGFFTAGNASSYLGLMSFWSKSRPLTFFVLNVIVSSLFFVFWIFATEKPEFFFMSVYALACAYFQARAVDTVYLRFRPEVLFSISLAARFYEGVFAMFLGFSFARVRRVVFAWGIPVALALPLVLLAVRGDVVALWRSEESVGRWVVPAFCLAGALACALQAFYLRTKRGNGAWLPARIRQLTVFSAGLAVLPLIQLGESFVAGGLLGSNATILVYRFAHLALVLFLGAVIARDYREKSRLVEKIPVSEYHRRATLPERISGALFVVDLKSSEPFYRMRASHGDQENLVSIWRSLVYRAVLRHRGVVIEKKGDEVIAVFDQEKCPDPVLATVITADEIARDSELLATEYRNQGLLPEGVSGFFFRASVSEGEIRPVWEEVERGSREPAWEEAGSTNAFVEAARLLDFEKKIAPDRRSTRLVLRDSLAANLCLRHAGLQSRFALRGRTLHDKHGNEYQVAAYEPRRESLTSVSPPP